MQETVAITNQSGQTLNARIDHAVGRCRGWAIFAHCFTCSSASLAAARVAQELAAEGIATLRLDFTGLGASEGAFEETSFTSNMGDIASAAEWLAEHHTAPALLVGHSLGGAAVLGAAKALSSVKGVATIGAPAEPAHVRHLFADAIKEIDKKGVAEINIGGRPIRIGKEFVEDLANHDGAKSAASLKADLLVLHAPLDSIVGIDNAASIYNAAKHPKSFVSLDKADHLLSRRPDSLFAARVISAWASRCLGEADEAATPLPDDGAVLVASSGDSPYAHDVSIGRHRLRVDEPASIPGGMDSGPAPYDFLKTGLGACTAITIRLVAERKGWPLEHCEVVVEHRKEGEGAEVRDVYSRRLKLHGPLDDEQRAALLGIADRCPVHRSFERSSEVETVLDGAVLDEDS